MGRVSPSFKYIVETFHRPDMNSVIKKISAGTLVGV